MLLLSPSPFDKEYYLCGSDPEGVGGGGGESRMLQQ